MNILTNYIFTGIISGILAVFLFFLDSKITKKKKTKFEYFKIFTITCIINGLIIYIMKMNNLFNIVEVKKEIKEGIKEEIKEVINSAYPDF